MRTVQKKQAIQQTRRNDGFSAVRLKLADRRQVFQGHPRHLLPEESEPAHVDHLRESKHMTIRSYTLALALLTMSVCVDASETVETSSPVSAAYKCGSDTGMTIIAATADFSTSAPGPDKDGYRRARTGRQTFRCKGGPSVSVVVLPPQETGECGADGRVVITDITPPGGRKGTELIEFNRRCFFNDYITRIRIFKQDSHYSIERCSETNRFNKQAFVGCTTAPIASERT